jgi:ABC-type phosphate transport system permease subunit
MWQVWQATRWCWFSSRPSCGSDPWQSRQLIALPWSGDTASALPVQIYRWSDFPEPGFAARSAAAICVLLVFLVIMNLLAIVLRKRFERRW